MAIGHYMEHKQTVQPEWLEELVEVSARVLHHRSTLTGHIGGSND